MLHRKNGDIPFCPTNPPGPTQPARRTPRSPGYSLGSWGKITTVRRVRLPPSTMLSGVHSQHARADTPAYHTLEINNERTTYHNQPCHQRMRKRESPTQCGRSVGRSQNAYNFTKRQFIQVHAWKKQVKNSRQISNGHGRYTTTPSPPPHGPSIEFYNTHHKVTSASLLATPCSSPRMRWSRWMSCAVRLATLCRASMSDEVGIAHRLLLLRARNRSRPWVLSSASRAWNGICMFSLQSPCVEGNGFRG